MPTTVGILVGCQTRLSRFLASLQLSNIEDGPTINNDSAMRRYTARASTLTVSGLGSQARRWRSYDREELTPEALRKQLESGLGNDVYAQSLKLNPEEKTITTASGDLPVSPVLDPAWMKARRERQEAKRKPKELLGKLRKKTAANPYGAIPRKRCLLLVSVD